MADTFTRWDWDGVDPGANYTSWDDAIGGPAETLWDVVPEVVARVFRTIWRGIDRTVFEPVAQRTKWGE